MTHAIFSGKMRILQHNTPPKRVRRFPARPRKNTPTRPHERPRRVFAWPLPCPKSSHQTATPYSAIFFQKGRAFFLLSDFIRTQGSGKKRATGRENEASARRRRAAGAPKARRRRAGSAVTPPKKNTFFGPIFRIFPDSDMAPPPRGRLAGRFGGGVATGNDGPDFFLRLFVDFHFSMILW